jgi:hypothetical protein
MRTLLIGLILLASAPSGEAAETWTCAHVSGDSSDLYRFEVSPPDVTSHIGSLTDLHFRIIRNDEAGLVATARSQMFRAGKLLSCWAGLSLSTNPLAPLFLGCSRQQKTSRRL